MTLRLNSSGGGYVEADAPNIAGNYALTLPTSAGSANQFLKNSGTAGTLEFAALTAGNMPTGSVVQLVNGSSNQATNVLTSSTSYVDTGMFDVSITPVLAGSKIIVEFGGYHPHVNANNTNRGVAFKIYRNVNSGGWTDASTNHIEGYYQEAGGVNEWFDYTGRSKIVDSPTYTLGNSIGYKLYFRQSSNNLTSAYAHHTGGIQAYSDTTRISYTLTEVAA